MTSGSRILMLFPLGARERYLVEIERGESPRDFFYGGLHLASRGVPVDFGNTRRDPEGAIEGLWLKGEILRNRVTNFGMSRQRRVDPQTDTRWPPQSRPWERRETSGFRRSLQRIGHRRSNGHRRGPGRHRLDHCRSWGERDESVVSNQPHQDVHRNGRDLRQHLRRFWRDGRLHDESGGGGANGIRYQ